MNQTATEQRKTKQMLTRVVSGAYEASQGRRDRRKRRERTAMGLLVSASTMARPDSTSSAS